MPWNCLCTKQKKRPEISAPIIDPYENQKLILLPSKQGIAIYEKDESDDSKDINRNEKNAIDKTTEIETAPKLQLIKNDGLMNKNITKDLVCVKFNFGEDDNALQETVQDLNTDKTVVKEQTTKINATNEDSNYDELPLIHIEMKNGVNHFSHSFDSIPFIDDENLQHQEHQKSTKKIPNFHDDRFITVKSKNSGSKVSYEEISIREKIIQALPAIHKNAVSMVIVNGNDEPIEHTFENFHNNEKRLCHGCHRALHKSTLLRCKSCGLLLHEECVRKPKIRYSDASYIIYQQWLKGNEKNTFPTVFAFVGPNDAVVLRNNNNNNNNHFNKNRNIKFTLNDIKNKKKRRKSKNLDKRKTKVRKELEIKETDDSDIDIDDLNKTDEIVEAQIHKVVTTSVQENIHDLNDKSEINNENNNNCIKQETLVKLESTNINDKSDETDLNLIDDIYTSCDLLEETNEVAKSPSVIIEQSELNLSKTGTDTDIDNVNNDTNNTMATSIDEYDDPNYAKVVLRENWKNYGGQQIIPKSQSFPITTGTNNKVSEALHLHYVTQRIIASVLPIRNPHELSRSISDQHNNYEDKYERDLLSMLEQKHGKNYQMFDLESCLASITLEKLCELCKHIDAWLGSGREKVVVLQDRGDRQRLGTAIAAYLEYQKICGSSFPHQNNVNNEDQRIQHTIAKNWLDLDIFSMQKFLEDVSGPLRVPSHKRYLKYFSGLLSGNIKMNSSPLYLRYVSLESPPSWLHYETSSQSSEWRSFIKIYEGLRCVFTSDIHVIPISTRQFLFEIGSLRLRGDVTIRCYQIIPNTGERELMFSSQFHTCAVTKREISFGRSELDYACDDPRFPADHKISLHFGGTETPNESQVFVFQSPLIRLEPVNSIASWDSMENLNEGSSHTQGPLDGSLYATITKGGKSPTSPNLSNGRITPIQPLKPLRSSTQNLISPPPEFSNPKNNTEQITSEERYSRNSTPTPSISSRYSNKVSPNYEEIKIYTQDKNNNPTSKENTTVKQNYYTNKTGQNYPSTSQQIRVIESYHYNTVDNGNAATPTNNYRQQSGRESVRSPLTLSMDSGISSSGLVNRRVQGSSVSPSSFPSQASPQEDRHRELDDLLTDMLMTVQDIPDFGNNGQQQQQQQQQQSNYQKNHQNLSKLQNKSQITSSSTSILASTQQQQQQKQQQQQQQQHQQQQIQNQNTLNTNNIKRSQSYTMREENRDKDFYDTSSTTTTLTPPPSESGRETPLIGTLASSPSINNYQYIRDKREIQSDDGGVDLQRQSFAYPQQVRTEIILASDDEESIPYHARESSRPFTYGNITSGSGGQSAAMIKMQSGLSSPSLVRKTLGSNNNNNNNVIKKTVPRNDFEEMLRQRREKVNNEKYLISDKTTNGGNSATIDRSSYDYKSSPYGSDNKMYNTSTMQTSHKLNGYQYHEPLKRSNTMDGGFGRSTSTDGLSGQTWLQLQQQKLKAKKQQIKYDDELYESNSNADIKNRQFRSRSSASQRYDGYTSDTAMFDEVDYRRPLHVQTPRPNERNYHTLTTTTTTVKQNERPFVAVKRAHELAKQGVRSPPTSPLSVLSSSPHGQIAQAQMQQTQHGLLSVADGTPVRNGHGRLTSDININNNMPSPTIDNKMPSNLNNNIDNDNIHNTLRNNNYNNNNVNNNNVNTNNSNNNIEKDMRSIKTDVACGQLALDRLLASLAIESDTINYQENNINNNNNISNNNNSNYKNAKLSDETDYNNEAIKQMSIRNTTNINNNNIRILEPIKDNKIKHLTSESSENSSSISPSLSERSNGVSWSDQVREESFSSYRSETDTEAAMTGSSRPETPAFPVTPRTPYSMNYLSNGNQSPALPPKSPTSQRRLFNNSTWSLRSQKSTTYSSDWSKDLYSGNAHLQNMINQNDTMSCYTSRRNSTTSTANSEPQEVAPHLVKFVRDSSKYWYKPNITREEAVTLLRNAQPGTFIVRDSTTFANAFGLVVKVSHPPPGVQNKGPPGDELVRHFLVEPTTRGVRLKGCANEPVFSSLSALVYQHSITPLALPCKLLIPERDIQQTDYHSPEQQRLLTQGAACNVLYLLSAETESLTGPQAVRKAVNILFSRRPLPTPTQVHFKVTQQGITLTDNTRRLFFRKHYPASSISFCGTDPDEHRWSISTEGEVPSTFTIFAFVAKRSASSNDNQCHIFCELQQKQPATAIVSFANKVILGGANQTISRAI